MHDIKTILKTQCSSFYLNILRKIPDNWEIFAKVKACKVTKRQENKHTDKHNILRS